MWQSIKLLLPILLALAAVFLFFLIIPTVENKDSERVEIMARAQFAMRMAVQVAGMVIALGALVMLLTRRPAEESSHDLIKYGLCVLGGVLLIETHWSIVIVFGVIIITHLILRAWRGGPVAETPIAG